MSLLPYDVLIQILLRLPVKSVIRFKCVSKSWLYLISDPHFAISHYELAAARQTHKLMYLGANTHLTRSVYLDASADDASAIVAIKLDLQVPEPCSSIYILGSCRGFILLGTHRPCSYFYLWNPSTSALKQLPVSPSNAYPFFHGFGYDSSTDDYLVVQAYYISSAPIRVAEYMLLSLRANSWEKIDGPCLPYSSTGLDPNVGLLLNGALHWFAFGPDLWSRMKLVVAFDLVEKSFSEIPLPNDEYYHNWDHLWVHGGFLSLCYVDPGFSATSIWVMKEYKVHSSWTKSFVVPLYDIPYKYFYPICSTKSGDIYGESGKGELVKCSVKGELLERLGLESKAEGYCIYSHAAVYTESLLPLPGGHNGQAKMIDNNKQELAC